MSVIEGRHNFESLDIVVWQPHMLQSDSDMAVRECPHYCPLDSLFLSLVIDFFLCVLSNLQFFLLY